LLLRTTPADPRGFNVKLSDFGCVQLLRERETPPLEAATPPPPALLGSVGGGGGGGAGAVAQGPRLGFASGAAG
jgi:hypothetical protein